MKKRCFWLYPFFLAIVIISGCNNKGKPQKQSTISVFGTGTVLARPDMIQMIITLNKVAQTTKMAQEAVNKMVKQTLAILKEANIEDKNISTASLTFNTEYEYGMGRRVSLGQKAEQRITFSIDGIDKDNEKITRIIDQLIQINGIELNQIDFSVKNNTEYFIKSRELAFQKAVEKAEQYAELSKLKIAKVLNISEEVNQHISPINNRSMRQSAYVEAASDSDSAMLPSGELEITTKISAIFLLE